MGELPSPISPFAHDTMIRIPPDMHHGQTTGILPEIIGLIGDELPGMKDPRAPLGLFNGAAGDVLFLLHAAETVDRPELGERLQADLDDIQAGLHRLVQNPSLGYGLAGAGWLLEYLNQLQGKDYDPDLCSDIDRILEATTSADTWNREIELISGLAGIAVYAGRRSRKGCSEKLALQIVRHLEAMAETPAPDMVTWAQPPNSAYRLDTENRVAAEYNLSIAHGITGKLAALLVLMRLPAVEERARQLLEHGCNWLMSQRLEAPVAGYFPAASGRTTAARMGWCYGDLPIALTLARAGKALGRQDFTDFSKDVSLLACRRSAESGVVLDAGLCHGSAGLGLMFQLLHKELGLPELKRASDSWFEDTLRRFREQGLDGFQKYDGREQRYVACTGLLEGLAGIGLCLLGWRSGETDWADCLLLS